METKKGRCGHQIDIIDGEELSCMICFEDEMRFIYGE